MVAAALRTDWDGGTGVADVSAGAELWHGLVCFPSVSAAGGATTQPLQK